MEVASASRIARILSAAAMDAAAVVESVRSAKAAAAASASRTRRPATRSPTRVARTRIVASSSAMKRWTAARWEAPSRARRAPTPPIAPPATPVLATSAANYASCQTTRVAILLTVVKASAAGVTTAPVVDPVESGAARWRPVRDVQSLPETARCRRRDCRYRSPPASCCPSTSPRPRRESHSFD